jgi:hypothetical protein
MSLTAVDVPRGLLLQQLQQLQQQQQLLAGRTQRPGEPAASAVLAGEVLLLVGLCTAVAFICSIDRAAMSVAVLPMSLQFGWDDTVKAAIASSFFAGYMVRKGGMNKQNKTKQFASRRSVCGRPAAASDRPAWQTQCACAAV